MRHFGLLALSLALLHSGSAQAAQWPVPGAGDPRLRLVRYLPDEVVRLDGTLGYAMTIEFGSGERIETVSIGNSLGWQITPNRRASLLFLKPVDRALPTNMTVITNLRAYNFDLRVSPAKPGDERRVIFGVRFDVPEPAPVLKVAAAPPPPPEPPKAVNSAYSYKGSAAGLPSKVFDDGKDTYFEFPATTDYPAIFAIEDDKKEAVMNVAQRDGYLVVDRLARGFVLRRGKAVTKITNDGYREAVSTTTLRLRQRIGTHDDSGN